MKMDRQKDGRHFCQQNPEEERWEPCYDRGGKSQKKETKKMENP